ncbi:MAG: LVIVD repeat-containing protein [Candidatus Heimdallarchaeota archaeon]
MKRGLYRITTVLVVFTLLFSFLGNVVVGSDGNGYLEEVAQIDTGGWALDVWVEAGFAYLTDLEAGFRIYDVTNPSSPEELAHMFSSGGAHQMFLDTINDLVYLGNHVHGLEIINVSDPNNPKEIGHTYNEGGYVTDAYLVDNLLYIIEHGLTVLDVSDPGNPVRLGHFSGDDYMSDIKVVGNYGYLSHGQFGLDILDISDPTNITKVGTYVDEGIANNAEVIGNLLFLADWDAGLKILNISDRNFPAKIGESESITDYAGDLTIFGDLAFVGGWVDGLYVYNISNPMRPVLKTSYHDGGKATGVYVQDDLVYVADTTEGLEILKIRSGTTETSTSLEFMLPFALCVGLVCVHRKIGKKGV